MQLHMFFYLENVDLGWAGAREPRGWGEYYDWVNILDATEEFAEDKPILLLVIPEDCDDCVHCSAIREEFKNDQELLRISKHFHIVNFLGYEESQAHWDPKIANAHYFPRFYFLEAHGDIIPWAVNTLRKDDRVFYYNHASEILNTAKEVFHGYYKYKHDEL